MGDVCTLRTATRAVSFITSMVGEVAGTTASRGSPATEHDDRLDRPDDLPAAEDRGAGQALERAPPIRVEGAHLGQHLDHRGPGGPVAGVVDLDAPPPVRSRAPRRRAAPRRLPSPRARARPASARCRTGGGHRPGTARPASPRSPATPAGAGRPVGKDGRASRTTSRSRAAARRARARHTRRRPPERRRSQSLVPRRAAPDTAGGASDACRWRCPSPPPRTRAACPHACRSSR